jgi:hypothetical protein
MKESLFEFFKDKFETNLPVTKTYEEAFEKTNRDLGFVAYTSLKSFRVQCNKKKRGYKAP